jgi:23S rRNA (guanine2535-N1)-methyltransferase
MAYRYAVEREDYSSFASGQVLHSAPGQTAFPVRLASEIFQRCTARLREGGVAPPYTLYDPCAGGAQLVTTLAFLHGDEIGSVVASDVDPAALQLAERNLALLTPSGLDARIAQLDELHRTYGKPSHAAALEHARALRTSRPPQPIPARLFQANATDPSALGTHLGPAVGPAAVDLVITDVPYGRGSTWHVAAAPPSVPSATPGAAAATSPTARLLDALLPVLRLHAVVAIAADKDQRVRHDAYRRVDYLRIGHRHVTFLTPTG